MGPGERLLVWRLRRGDPEACRELIRRHHAGVYGYLRRLGADPGDAEDLTQETYLRAWRHIASLRDVASLRSWLLTIARNQFLQWHRSERPEAAVVGDVPDEADDAPGAESTLERARRDLAVRRAVERLEPDLRETVALHYFQELSLREVAAVLGLPVGTAKSRIHRALDDLGKSLERWEVENEDKRAAKAIASHS